MVKKKSTAKKKVHKNYMPIIAISILMVLAILFVAVRMLLKTPSDRVVAYVNGEPLYYSEIARVREITNRSGYQTEQLTDSEILDQIINKKLLVQAAKDAGITVTNEDFEKLMDAYYIATGTNSTKLKENLATMGVDFEELKKDMMERMLISEYINKTINSNIKINESELRAYYSQHLEEFTMPPRVLLAHIIVNNSQLAEQLLDKLKQGANFSELARNYSQDSSAAQGGVLGWFSDEQLIPELSSVAFSLEPGSVSDVVKTNFGYHIVKVLNKTYATLLEFDQVKAQLEAYMTAEEQANKMLELIQQLRQDSDIKILLKEQERKLASFSITNRNICYENGLPIIRVYCTSTSPHCNWIKPAFMKIAKAYKGKVEARFWYLDTGDDLMTEQKESKLPIEEKELYYQFNPNRTVPTFIFGCKFYRVGNIYEGDNELTKEEADFRAVIEALLASS